MNIVSTVEIRTARPVTVGVKGKRVKVLVACPGGKYAVCRSVKIHSLSKGGYSIRTLGGGFATLKVTHDTYMVVVAEDDSTVITGTVAEVFAAGKA